MKKETPEEAALRKALKKEAMRQPIKGGKERIDRATGNDKRGK